MTATDKQRPAHRQVLLWSPALTQQLDRLHADRLAAGANQRKVSKAGHYGPSDSWRFYMLNADKH